MMRDDRPEDIPPYSRLFVVCSKVHRQDDLRPAFEIYGDIEHFTMPKDRNTGDSKGIAYIKYRKTSSAAAAIEALHMSHLANSAKPIKVMVACKKNEEVVENDNRYKRLFIKVSKDATESEIEDHFKKFGNVSVYMQRNRDTKESKGFAYVNFNTFLEAAVAFESCDKKYKPMFATPKEDLKRSRNSYDHYDKYPSSDSVYVRDDQAYYYREHNQREELVNRRESIMPLITTPAKDFDTISVSCSPFVPQKPLQKLFNVVPGMIQFKFTIDTFNGLCKAVVKYETKTAAAHALEMLNNYEFPSGELITVRPADNPLSQVANNLSNIVNSFKNSLDTSPDLKQLADVIAQASTLIQAATSGSDIKSESNDGFCSVRLPPAKPMANPDSTVAQRCFIVLKPNSLSTKVLRDVFCRFGDLIDVIAQPNKSFGFAKYASTRAAQEAMKTLHGATVYGVRLKVLEAEERPTKDKTHDENESSNTDYTERKRAKLEIISDDDL